MSATQFFLFFSMLENFHNKYWEKAPENKKMHITPKNSKQSKLTIWNKEKQMDPKKRGGRCLISFKTATNYKAW